MSMQGSAQTKGGNFGLTVFRTATASPFTEPCCTRSTPALRFLAYRIIKGRYIDSYACML
jgi:hypothetical protein